MVTVTSCHLAPHPGPLPAGEGAQVTAHELAHRGPLPAGEGDLSRRDSPLRSALAACAISSHLLGAGVALLMLLVACASAAQPHRPAVLLRGDLLIVTLPDSILKDRGVRNRLESALTTTFVLKVRVRGAKNESIARIEIRYDLWDENYRVRRAAGQNRGEPERIARALLEPWWRTPIEMSRFTADRATVDIELVVLPFSSAEESDAREWLSKSGGARDPSSNGKSIVDVLIGTTLSARPVVSYTWSAEIVRR